MRKIEVNLTVRMIVSVDEGVEIDQIINELEYDFNDTTTQATVEDTEIIGYDIVDSK